MSIELREPTFFILLSLAEGPKHGYAIIADTIQLSDERVHLKAGTLYTALDRLTGEGLVQTAGEEVVDGRLRRYVTLTDSGRTVLEQETERQRRNAERAIGRMRSARTTAKGAPA